MWTTTPVRPTCMFIYLNSTCWEMYTYFHSNIIFSRTNTESPTGEQTSDLKTHEFVIISKSVFAALSHEGGETFPSRTALHVYVLDRYEFFEHQEEGCRIRRRSISCGVNTDFLNVLPGPLHLSPFEFPL